MADQDRDVSGSYDPVAEEYTTRISGELAGKPVDRALLDDFAEIVRPLGRAVDVGCGPGHIAAYLRERGVDVLGVDPSRGMIEQACDLNPEIAFIVGGMPDLPIEDGSVAGVVAFYSIIHLPHAMLPLAIADVHRVLMPGGIALIAFHLGEADDRLDEFWGIPVSIDFYGYECDEVERALTGAGFRIERSLEREPYAPEIEYQSRRAYIVARK